MNEFKIALILMIPVFISAFIYMMLKIWGEEEVLDTLFGRIIFTIFIISWLSALFWVIYNMAYMIL